MTKTVRLTAFVIVILLSASLLISSFAPAVEAESTLLPAAFSNVVQVALFAGMFGLAGIALPRTSLVILFCAFAALAGAAAVVQYLNAGTADLLQLAARISGLLLVPGSMLVQAVRSEQALVHPPLTARRHDR